MNRVTVEVVASPEAVEAMMVAAVRTGHPVKITVVPQARWSNGETTAFRKLSPKARG